MHSIKEVNGHNARRTTTMLETYIQQVRAHMDKSLEPFTEQKAALQYYHRIRRKDLFKKHEERKNQEEKERFQRLPKGFKALWSRMSGK